MPGCMSWLNVFSVLEGDTNNPSSTMCLCILLKVWTALLGHMPLLALMKNINRLGSLGLLDPSSNCLQTVIDKLANEQHLHNAKYVTVI